MDYKKDIEERLIKYSHAEETLKNLNNRLNKLSLRGCPRELGAIDFSKIGHGTMSNEAFNDVIEVQHILKQINKIKIEEELIRDTLEIIKNENEEDYNFISFKYFDKLSMDQVATKLGYSQNSHHTIYSVKDRALSKFAYLYWGEN